MSKTVQQIVLCLFCFLILSSCEGPEQSSPSPKAESQPQESEPKVTETTSETSQQVEQQTLMTPITWDEELPEGIQLLTKHDAAEFSVVGANTSVGKAEIVSVEGMPFKQAVRAVTVTPAKQLWDAQLNAPINEKVNQGDTIVVRFSIRCVTDTDCRGQTAYLFEKSGEPYTKSVDNGIQFGSTWETFQFAFQSKESYDAGQANLIFRMGFEKPQAFEMGGVELVNYGVTISPEMFVPVISQFRYAGQEADAPWRVEAEQRIEQYRKGDLTVRVTDAAGKPIQGAEVTVQMKKHAFHFGSAVSAQFIYNDKNSADYERYKKEFVELFNTAVIENALKWPPFEGEWGTWARPGADESISWLAENGIAVRGHTLVWPGFSNLPKDIPSLKNDKEKLRKRIHDHIVEEAEYFKGRVIEWDVINEPHLNHDLMDILGRDEMFEWIKTARETDPSAKLYINETGIEQSESVMETMESILKRAKELKVKVDGLGIQSHFENGISLVPPEKLYEKIDRLASYLDAIKATEFDIAAGDEQLEADYTRDFMTVFFSHPKADGILMWGFWDGRHWKNNAPIFRKDWSLKPSGQVYRDLVFNKWWTDGEGVTNEDGEYKVRGFHGDYEITVSKEGASKTIAVSLDKQGTEASVVMD